MTIVTAIDLPSLTQLEIGLDRFSNNFPTGEDKLKIIFLSRISPMKNLDFALSIFSSVSAEVQFDIYGPKENLEYWKQCNLQIISRPKNIYINYRGSVLPENIQEVFSNYDLFLFPSRGENYGHVIAESLSVETIVFISNRTPWNNLQEKNLGWDIKLEDKLGFFDVINSFSLSLSIERKRDRCKAVNALKSLLLDPEKIEENRKLFSIIK